jgi:hypothetical protein
LQAKEMQDNEHQNQDYKQLQLRGSKFKVLELQMIQLESCTGNIMNV